MQRILPLIVWEEHCPAHLQLEVDLSASKLSFIQIKFGNFSLKAMKLLRNKFFLKSVIHFIVINFFQFLKLNVANRISELNYIAFLYQMLLKEIL